MEVVISLRNFVRFYRLANLLNLDVAFGALGSMFLGASVCRASMPAAWCVLLPLAVWATYTLDHLLDSKRLPLSSTAPRHRIATQYVRSLTVGVGLVIATLCVGGMLLLPYRLLWLGGVIGLATLVHLGAAYAEWYQATSSFVKEFVVALLYGTGTWGGPFLLMPTSFSVSILLLFLTFFLIVLLNLGLFQWFERKQARQFCPEPGEDICATCFIDLGFLGFAAALGGGFVFSLAALTPELLLLVGMGGMLWSMRLAPQYFLLHERFRLWGDGVFLVPLLLLLGKGWL